MKKLIPLFIVLAAGIASAEWKLNPYTQRQDYYESKAGIAASTGTLTIGLAAEIARATARENAIAASTGTLTTGLATEISNRQIADAAIAVSTGANAAAISALDAAKVNRAGDTMTGQLNVSSNVVATSSMTAAYFQGGGANFPLPVTGISLSEIEDLEANKTFTMANKTLTWNFTNPSGGMAWNFTGAAAGHSLDIMQTGGNPGADMHLLHVHSEDPDPTTLHLVPGGATSKALMTHANGDTLTNPGRFELNGNGDMAWGTGAGATDATLARTGIGALQTNSTLTAAGFSGPLTGLASLNLPLTGGTLTGPLTLAGSSLTVNGAFAVQGSTFVIAGGKVIIGAGSQTVSSNLEIVNNGVIPYLSLYRNGVVAWRIQPTVATGKDLIFDPAHGAAQNVIFNNSAGALSVGIGTTSPDQKLTVVGNISATGQVISSGTGSNYFAGNVGIKTNAPGEALHVKGQLWVGVSGGATDNVVYISKTATYGLLEAYDFGGGGAKPLSINPNGGAVSIGTNAATSKLQVVGLVEYADNAAAAAAGLTAGAFYRTGDVLKVVH